MIRAEALSKHFHTDGSTIKAVDGLDLQVDEGEVFGFLGPNGAGKTTTVRLLTCLIGPTSGRAWINGLAVGKEDRQIRGQVGILTEAPGLYERLSVQQNLEVFAKLYDVGDVLGQVEKYLRLLGLWERRSQDAGTLSKGMKQKLSLARALLHEPPVLFLDEPTSALDPESAKTVRDFVSSLRSEGRTIFLCTHNLGEAEQLCDRIAVFRQRVIAVDTPDALRRLLFGRQTVVQVGKLEDGFTERIREFGFVKAVHVMREPDGSGQLLIDLADPVTENPAIVQRLVAMGAQIRFVTEVRHSLEEVYLSLIRNGGSGEGTEP